MRLVIILITVILVIALLFSRCSSPIPSPPEKDLPSSPSPGSTTAIKPTNGLVQSNTSGSVTIDVEWAKIENGSLIFNVAMDTHSVDLDKYDLGELALLRDDAGNEYHPVSWKSAAGGHHRQGSLTFPLPDSVSQTKYLEIVIHDIADVKEMVLKWEL